MEFPIDFLATFYKILLVITVNLHGPATFANTWVTHPKYNFQNLMNIFHKIRLSFNAAQYAELHLFKGGDVKQNVDMACFLYV